MSEVKQNLDLLFLSKVFKSSFSSRNIFMQSLSAVCFEFFLKNVVNMLKSYVQNEHRRLLGMTSSYELVIAQYSDKPIFDHMYSY